MIFLRWATLLAATALVFAAVPLHLRTRVEAFRGSGDWRSTTIEYAIEPRKTAIVLCDMWDKHWCRGSSERVDKLAPKIEAVVAKLRAQGVLIIHAPSDTMDFYKNDPSRLAAASLAKATLPEVLNLDAPKLPIDDASGGCETKDKNYKAWTREHPAIHVLPQDLVTDKGDEVYSALKLRGIETLLVAGVHTNFCILNRTFAIKQMTKWGVKCILLRDLTDSMYDPDDAPHVSHDRGTELVIEHIERYWAPTVTSGELLSALNGRR